MFFSTNTTLAVLAILASASTVTAVPHHCPHGRPTVTVTVSVTDTATVTVGFPDSTQGHSTPTHPVPTHPHPHPHPTPSHTFSPLPPGTGNGNGNGNSGSNGNGSGNGNGGSEANLCCNMTGQANSVEITTRARSLDIKLSGKTGLAGLLCNAIGEGSLTECSGSLLTCSTILGDLLGGLAGSDCSL